MSTSIPISQLNPLGTVTSNDYLPIVQNSTTTTFNTSLNTIANWISSSVVASSSLSSLSANSAATSNFANVSNLSVSSSFLIYSPNNGTASFAVTSSNATTASFALQVLGGSSVSISSSWSSASLFSTSASFASRSISSITSTSSSFANNANVAISSSFANNANVAISSSFANTSVSSSYTNTALTASYITVNTVGAPYPYIYSMSFFSLHDDSLDICYGNNPTYTYNATSHADGFSSASNHPILGPIGMFSWPWRSGEVSRYHGLQFNTSTNTYVMTGSYMSSVTPRTGSVTGPLQIMTMWCDNRGGSDFYLYFQSPIVVTFAIAPGTFKTFTMNFLNPSGTSNFRYSTFTFDARLINYMAFNPLIQPIYQDWNITNPFFTSYNAPAQVLNVASS